MVRGDAMIGQRLIYIQIRRGWLSIEIYDGHDKVGEAVGAARIAYRISLMSLAVGQVQDSIPLTAEGADFEEYAAFSHPRVLIDRYDLTLAVMRHFMGKAMRGLRGTWVKPTALVQVIEYWEGGVTDFERRTLMRLAEEIGARHSYFIDKLTPCREDELWRLIKQEMDAR